MCITKSQTFPPHPDRTIPRHRPPNKPTRMNKINILNTTKSNQLLHILNPPPFLLQPSPQLKRPLLKWHSLYSPLLTVLIGEYEEVHLADAALLLL